MGYRCGTLFENALIKKQVASVVLSKLKATRGVKATTRGVNATVLHEIFCCLHLFP